MYDALRCSAFKPLIVFLVVLVGTATGCARQEEGEPAGRWETLTPSSGEPAERHENAYVRVGDRFYLIGGRGERPVQIYDPAAGSWETGAMPPISMHHFQAVAHEGRVYVLGAFTGDFPDETPIANVYVYDPEADEWTEGPEIPENRRRGAAGAVAYEGRIYLVGGIRNGHLDGQVNWLDAFDPAAGTWEPLPDAPRPRDHFQTAVADGKLYAVAGRRTSQATGEPFELTIPEIDVYDIAEGTWTALPSSADLPTERAGAMTVSAGGNVIVLGGESGSQTPAHAEVECFDPETGTWQSLAPMNEGRHGTQAVVYEGYVYVAAGSKTRGATEINSHEAFELPEAVLER